MWKQINERTKCKKKTTTTTTRMHPISRYQSVNLLQNKILQYIPIIESFQLIFYTFYMESPDTKYKQTFKHTNGIMNCKRGNEREKKRATSEYVKLYVYKLKCGKTCSITTFKYASHTGGCMHNLLVTLKAKKNWAQGTDVRIQFHVNMYKYFRFAEKVSGQHQ